LRCSNAAASNAFVTCAAIARVVCGVVTGGVADATIAGEAVVETVRTGLRSGVGSRRVGRGGSWGSSRLAGRHGSGGRGRGWGRSASVASVVRVAAENAFVALLTVAHIAITLVQGSTDSVAGSGRVCRLVLPIGVAFGESRAHSKSGRCRLIRFVFRGQTGSGRPGGAAYTLRVTATASANVHILRAPRATRSRAGAGQGCCVVAYELGLRASCRRLSS